MFHQIVTRLRLQRDLAKLSLLRDRDFDGYFASMHQAGNHWLRHVLSMVIAERFGLPEPEHIGDMQLVGEPRCPTLYQGIPRLVFSHRICSPLVHSAAARALLMFPRYVILVRDLRSMLVSHYERFGKSYQISLSEYLRGDVAGRRFDCDLWDCIRFLNAWGRVSRRFPARTLAIRFEDLKGNMALEAQHIWQFLELDPTDAAVFRRATAASTKDRMKQKEAAAGKHGCVIRGAARDPLSYYSRTDRQFFVETCRRYLREDFGYDYSRFDAVEQAPRTSCAPVVNRRDLVSA